jgi:ligand-binding sensor domain-containing protein
VQALLIDDQGSLWVGTWAGLSRRKAGSDRFEPVFSGDGEGHASLAGRIVQALFQASDGRIWVGTQQGDVAIVDPATDKGLFLDYAQDIANQGAVSSLVEASGGQMWVGRSTGIDLHTVADGRLVQRLRHDPRRRSGLAGNEVTALLRDQAGLIWVGGFGVGLQRHDPNNQSIWLRGADAQIGSPFSQADVRSLLQVDNGEIWAATNRGGVAVMDSLLRVTGALWPRTPKQALAASQAEGQPLPPVRVEAMAQAGDGSVWLGADSMLYQFGQDHRQLQTLPHAGGLVRRLLAARDGSLWVATQDGVFRWRPGSAEVVRISQPQGQALRADINALAEASDGSVWVGSGKGLFRVAAGGDELLPVEAPAGAGLGNPSVIGLLFDSEQTLWVDTAVSGLHRMRSWDGRQRNFRAHQRTPWHRQPAVWRQFDGGCARTHLDADVRLRSRQRPARRVDCRRRCRSRHRLVSLTSQDADGRLLFGGSKGILVVRPERFDASAYAPPLLISELTINGQRQPAGGILDGSNWRPAAQLQPGFYGGRLQRPGRMRYAYQLQGFDPDWIETSADSRVASYSNLYPGDYVLRVRATNRSGAWSPHELAIPVRMSCPPGGRAGGFGCSCWPCCWRWSTPWCACVPAICACTRSN